ncbi:unnamed protein product, partial [Vitis vinifera]
MILIYSGTITCAVEKVAGSIAEDIIVTYMRKSNEPNREALLFFLRDRGVCLADRRERIHQEDLPANSTVRFIQTHQKLHQFLLILLCPMCCSVVGSQFIPQAFQFCVIGKDRELLLSKTSNISLNFKDARHIALRESLIEIFPNFMSSRIIDYTVRNFWIESIDDPGVNHVVTP